MLTQHPLQKHFCAVLMWHPLQNHGFRLCFHSTLCKKNKALCYISRGGASRVHWAKGTLKVIPKLCNAKMRWSFTCPCTLHLNAQDGPKKHTAVWTTLSTQMQSAYHLACEASLQFLGLQNPLCFEVILSAAALLCPTVPLLLLCPALSCSVLLCPAASYPALFCPTLSCSVLFCSVLLCWAKVKTSVTQPEAEWVYSCVKSVSAVRKNIPSL